jgi:hypothetical protein
MPIFTVARARPPPPAPAGVSFGDRIERLLTFDGAHEQLHALLLFGEHVLDGGADGGPGPVGAAMRPGHWPILGLFEVDHRASADSLQGCLIGFRTIGGVSPSLAGGDRSIRKAATVRRRWRARLSNACGFRRSGSLVPSLRRLLAAAFWRRSFQETDDLSADRSWAAAWVTWNRRISR